MTHLERPAAGKDGGQEEKGMTEDEMVGWQTLGDGEGQGSLACCSSLGSRVRHDFAIEQQLLIFHMIIIMIMTILPS